MLQELLVSGLKQAVTPWPHWCMLSHFFGDSVVTLPQQGLSVLRFYSAKKIEHSIATMLANLGERDIAELTDSPGCEVLCRKLKMDVGEMRQLSALAAKKCQPPHHGADSKNGDSSLN
jgi:hypothetical protein